MQKLLEKHRIFSIADAVEIIIGILDGLAHLHNRKIIHRDLKPDNVLFQGKIPRLTDFGISRAMPIDSYSKTVMGTYWYMSPEALKKKRNAQTDIWSVGVILYQLLTGNLPFPQDELPSLITAVMYSEPEPLPNDIPLALEKVVMKALAKESSERYQTAEEMRKDLSNLGATLPQSFSAQTTQPSIPEENKDTLPFVKSEEVEVTEPYVNFFSSQASNNQAAETERFESEFKIPTPVSSKIKTNKLYFAVPAILFLLFSSIGVGLWLNNRASNDKQTISSNTSSEDVPLPVSKATPPIQDENGKTLLIPFRKGDKFGFSDSNKELVIEAKYDDAKPFLEDIAIVSINKKYGFINRIGKEIIPIKYRFVSSFSEGLSSVKLNNKDGFIDKSGKVVIPFKYDYPLGNFSEGLASARLDKKEGFIDKTGKVIIQLVYDRTYTFSDGLVSVKLNNKYGFIDKTGKEIIPLKYNSAYDPFSEGLTPVAINNKYGFIDKTDKEIIPFEYDFAFSFSEGLASVKLKDKYGFIDKTGKVIIPFKYDATFSFSKGLARVRLNNNKWFYIDRNGTEYYEP